MGKVRLGITLGAACLALVGCDTSAKAGGSLHHHSATTTWPMALPASSTTTKPPIPTNTSAHLTVNTANMTVGDAVTINGSGCPVGDYASVMLDQLLSPNFPLILRMGAGAYVAAEDTVAIGLRVDRAGTWTFSGSLPMIVDGPTSLGATCSTSENGQSPRFYYPSMDVSVVTPFKLDVAPGLTVDAGTTLTVKPVDGGCVASALHFANELWVDLFAVPTTSDQPATVIAGELARGASPTSPSPGALTVTGSIQGMWQATLTVPPDTPGGAYVLEADCDYARGGIVGSYEPTTITVR